MTTPRRPPFAAATRDVTAASVRKTAEPTRPSGHAGGPTPVPGASPVPASPAYGPVPSELEQANALMFETTLALPPRNTMTGRIFRVIAMELARRAGELDAATDLSSIAIYVKVGEVDLVLTPRSVRISPDYYRTLHQGDSSG